MYLNNLFLLFSQVQSDVAPSPSIPGEVNVSFFIIIFFFFVAQIHRVWKCVVILLYYLQSNKRNLAKKALEMGVFFIYMFSLFRVTV